MPIRNLEAVKRQIAQIPGKVSAEVKKAQDQNADEMVDLAKSLAPKRTGALAASIRAQPGATALSTEVVADKFYARFVEFGTRGATEGDTVQDASGRTRKAGRTHPGTKAQPFFYPAYRALKKRMKGRATGAANKAIKAGVS